VGLNLARFISEMMENELPLFSIGEAGKTLSGCCFWREVEIATRIRVVKYNLGHWVEQLRI
jgi:hypothetical protein